MFYESEVCYFTSKYALAIVNILQFCKSALHLAAENGHAKAVEILLDHKANIECESEVIDIDFDLKLKLELEFEDCFTFGC